MTTHAIDAFRAAFAYERSMIDRTLAQLDEREIHQRPLSDANSPAQIINHLAGNLASRFTDFRTTDGEKPSRDRDAEFADAPSLSKSELENRWQRGWSVLDSALVALTDADLAATVTIRGEPHTVARALTRALDHQGYHTGQLVLLAKAIKGHAWQHLTVPPGGTKALNQEMRERHGDF